MPGLTMQVLLQDIRTLETDALVVGLFEDVRPLKSFAGQLDWLLCGALSRLLLEKRLQGRLGDVALLTSLGKVPAGKIFMVGCGPRASFSLESLRIAAGTVAASVTGAGVVKAAVEYLQPDLTACVDCMAALRDGFSEGAEGRQLAVTLLAPDKAMYGQLSRCMQFTHR